MASSDTRNSFARAVALTGRPRSSRLSISFFLIGPDEPCTNKKIPCTIKKHNRSALQDATSVAQESACDRHAGAWLGFADTVERESPRSAWGFRAFGAR